MLRTSRSLMSRGQSSLYWQKNIIENTLTALSDYIYIHIWTGVAGVCLCSHIKIIIGIVIDIYDATTWSWRSLPSVAMCALSVVFTLTVRFFFFFFVMCLHCLLQSSFALDIVNSSFYVWSVNEYLKHLRILFIWILCKWNGNKKYTVP